MPKSHSVYICQQCGYHSPTYLGKCPQCNSWNSFVEQIAESHQPSSPSGARSRQTGKKIEIINLSSIEKTDYKRIDTGFEEFNRVLGGGPPAGRAGIVPGSLVLTGGEPGIGKSTLLTQLALNLTDKTDKSDRLDTLYVAGEESARQIKIRVDRITPRANLSILNETDVDVICETIEQLAAINCQLSDKGLSLVIIDSIQTLETADLTSPAGSIGQVRECAHRLQKLAKNLHISIFLVGHVTKEGNIAGPKTLEHIVDVVLSLEGDPTSQFKILRSTKNRFGPTDEVGIFEMEEFGMIEVKNPSQLFLENKVNEPGSLVTATLNGLRPILVEIQALVVKSFLAMPRRIGAGIDNNRLQLLAAVLSKRLNLPLFDKDIFVNVTGGLRVFEPAADLAICLAIVSSLKDQKVSPKLMAVGEVGLLGEIRGVRGMEKRVSEAKKLGFTNVISAANAKTLTQAANLVFAV